MADLAPSDIRARYPEFTAAEYPDPIVAAAIADAYSISDTSRRATVACAAHLLAIMAEETGSPDGGSGELTSESTGPVRASYRSQAECDRDVFFTRTAYGRSMLEFESRTPKAQFSLMFA